MGRRVLEMKLIKKNIRKILSKLYQARGKSIERFIYNMLIHFRWLSKKIYAYQPFFGEASKNLKFKHVLERECEDRWDVIKKTIPDNCYFVSDVGSQNGYFLMKMVEQGYYGIGYEIDEDSTWISKQIALINNMHNANFYNVNVTPEISAHMPSSDITICMSVFHHWVRNQSLSYANDVMQGIVNSTRKCLIFETGQSDEEADWASSLDFMKDSPKEWIRNYLIELGFKEVKYLGDFNASHISNVNRHLFVAYK